MGAFDAFDRRAADQHEAAVAIEGQRDRPAALDEVTRVLGLVIVGGWYIWISFAVAVGKRVPLDAFYWPMAVLVVAIAGVRLLAMYRRNRRPITVEAPNILA